jgi:hypothetical protein
VSGEIEPYDFRALTAYLESKGARRDRQTGDHIHFHLPNGKRVGSGVAGKVTSALARQNARALGITYRQMRKEIGHPIVDAGRSRYKPAPIKRRPSGATKRQVLDRFDAAVGDLQRARAAVACGQRGQAVYDRVFGALAVVEDAIVDVADAAHGRAAS